MEAKIIFKQAFKVIGMKYHGKNENNEIPQLWDEFWKRIDEVKGMAQEPMTAFGVCTDLDCESGEFDYIASIGVTDDTDIPDGMLRMVIPGQEYAVFDCTLPTILKTYDKALKKWLPDSEYKRLDGPDFELYEQDFDPQKPDSKMFIYIPVVKK